MSWFVLSVKRNQENKVADILQKMNVEVFNPLVKEVKYWSNRKKIIEYPLFKSMVFAKLPEKYKGLVFAVPEIEGYMFLNGKATTVSEEDIYTIKSWVDAESQEMAVLSKLISQKEISVKHWLSNSESGVKWIGSSNVFSLIDKMDDVVKEKLRKVI